jgi:hypothetical protein
MTFRAPGCYPARSPMMRLASRGRQSAATTVG